MPDLDAFLGGRGMRGISAADRAVRAWARINDKPTSVTLYRNSAEQTAQTMRIEPDAVAFTEEVRGPGLAALARVLLFGVQDHPSASVADTDVQKGDLFTLDDGQYRVIDAWEYPGEVQARAERVT